MGTFPVTAPVYWPDPDAMVRELKEMGIELMVSIWPTVDKTSENYTEMLEKGYLIRTERGILLPLLLHALIESSGIVYRISIPNLQVCPFVITIVIEIIYVL